MACKSFSKFPTAGLGMRAKQDPSFTSQFTAKSDAVTSFSVVTDGSASESNANVDAIGGSTITSKSVTKGVNYGDEKLCMYADEGWIVECFINLLDNCAEYLADDNTKVYVDVTRKNDDCVVTIADNGKGLSTQQFNSIFNRFETNGSAADFKAGIGLNLSKLVIEAHHGSIKAGNSEKYGGAEFVVTLPMYRLKTKYQSM